MTLKRELPPYRILVTGSRNHSNVALIRTALSAAARAVAPRPVTLVHGDATGTDTIAAGWARHNGHRIESHPADWDRHGKAAGPLRNIRMVNLGADLCLAFPLPDSRGTRHCMGAAAAAGIPVQEITA